MNGAIADPLANIMRAPNIKMITIKGKSQNFFRCFKKPHKSFRKSILASSFFVFQNPAFSFSHRKDILGGTLQIALSSRLPLLVQLVVEFRQKLGFATLPRLLHLTAFVIGHALNDT
jgi:hypothetical protein